MSPRSEKPLSQRNEILLKCLAHNIIAPTHEMFELGIGVEREIMEHLVSGGAAPSPLRRTF